MQKTTVEPQGLQLIRTERTSLIPAAKPRKQISGREYRRALKRAWFIVGVLLGINFVQAVLIWILQAGPI
ncbi:MAG TPA: hypothetical protein H9743_03305 [Candidatus Mediterraneibacter vanvlietii]|nr:hypothetical protein [Candidatus Mediterraneibacter vanvlietii]